MGIKTLKPLQPTDSNKYITEESDFAFEQRVLHRLRDLQYKCEHGGTYTDPVTGKARQFDIRAARNYQTLRIRLAVECKNISNATPLVAHCVPRVPEEAYHTELTASFTRNVDGRHIRDVARPTVRRSTRIYGHGPKHMVSKSLMQVWEEKDNGSMRVTGKDGDIYEKWSQAIFSCYDLVRNEGRWCAGSNVAYEGSSVVIMPILVVPDTTVWRVSFNEDGEGVQDPCLVDHVSFYVGKEMNPWTEQEYYSGYRPYWISHLEVITFGSLETTLRTIYECYTEKGVDSGNKL